MKIQSKKQIHTAHLSALCGWLSASTRGFTQMELMAILVVLGLLCLILLPAIARPGLNSKTIQCINNNRQLENAWRMYADDTSDVLPYACTGSSIRGDGSVPIDIADPTDPDNYAWSGAHMDYSGANRANWDPTYDLQKRPLWLYTSRNTSIYKCPCDTSTVNFLGKTYPRILSMAMNLYVGGFAPAKGSGSLAGTDGGWPFAAPYRIYSKLSLINSPSNIFVFLDVRQDAANWSDFMQDMTGYSPNNPASYMFADIPGMYHDRAASFSFADGHTEIKRWFDSRTTPPLSSPGQVLTIGSSPNNPDIYWLQSHSTTLK
jgi:prepilin-type processing-associated H-X9-DG protein